MKTLPTPSKLMMLARQLSMPLDMPQLRCLSQAERNLVVDRLASFLMAAAGVATGEIGDDE